MTEPDAHTVILFYLFILLNSITTNMKLDPSRRSLPISHSQLPRDLPSFPLGEERQRRTNHHFLATWLFSGGPHLSILLLYTSESCRLELIEMSSTG